MKKIILILITACLILTLCNCSCGSDPAQIANKAETEETSTQEASTNPEIADEEEDIFGDDDTDSNGEDNNSVSNEFPDATTEVIAPSVKTPQKVDDKTSLSTYASYLTEDEWLCISNEDTLNFKDDGTFNGKINGKEYIGTFNMRIKEKGICILGVTLNGTKKEVEYTVKFKNSAYITITTNTGSSASYASY